MNIPEKEKEVQENSAEQKSALCPYSTTILSLHDAHLKSHSRQNEKPFKCPECPFRAKRKDGVQNHVKNVHLTSTQSRVFPCSHPGCSYAAKEKAALNKHSKIHTGEKSFFCSHPNCKYSTNHKHHLVEHIRVHTGEKPFVCQFESCSYASATSFELVLHTRIHTKEKPYKCAEPHCEYSTTQSIHLKTHGLTHPPKEGKEHPSFKCPIELCAYSCKTKRGLSQHMKTHSIEKPFKCSFESCEFRCKFQSNLSVHLERHSEERQYKCQLCPFRAKTRKCVAKHLKSVHADPNFRPFKCTEPECDSSFKEQRSLQQHLLTHRGEKEYSCSVSECDYKAFQKVNVKAHEYNIHSDKKNEQCRICDFRCKTKTQLITHIRTHTKEEPFACKEEGCKYRAKRTSNLAQHKKTKHHPCIVNLRN